MNPYRGTTVYVWAWRVIAVYATVFWLGVAAVTIKVLAQ